MRVRVGCILGFIAAFSSLFACEASPPRACQVYLDCYYGEARSPYLDDPDHADLADPEARRAAQDAYGSAGECWRFGPDDPLWRVCERACLEPIVEACTRHARAESAACVTDAAPGESHFGVGGSTLACSDAGEALSALSGTPAPPSEPVVSATE